MYRVKVRVVGDGLGLVISDRDVARLCLGEGDEIVIAEVIRNPAVGTVAVEADPPSPPEPAPRSMETPRVIPPAPAEFQTSADADGPELRTPDSRGSAVRAGAATAQPPAHFARSPTRRIPKAPELAPHVPPPEAASQPASEPGASHSEEAHATDRLGAKHAAEEAPASKADRPVPTLAERPDQTELDKTAFRRLAR